MTYYTLAVKDADTGQWGAQFGDYDRDTVKDERADMADGYDRIPKCRMRILTTSEQQSDIDAAIAALNGKEPVWRDKHDINKLADECWPVVSGTPALDAATTEQMNTLFNRWKLDGNGKSWVDFARSAIPFDYGAIGVQWCGMWIGIDTDGHGHI